MQVDQVDFADAFAKGLGRAIVYLRQCADPSSHLPLIRRACVVSPRWDFCESDRAPYIIEAIKAGRMVEECKRAAIEAGVDGAADTDEWHLATILCLLAKMGHADAHAALRASVERCITTRSFQGGSDLIDLEGLAGMLFLAARAGGSIPKEDGWRHGSWIQHCAQQPGLNEELVREALSEHAAHCEATAAFLAAEAKWEAREPEPDDEDFHSLEEIVRAAGADAPQDSRTSIWLAARRWGRGASQQELELASRLFVETGDPRLVQALRGAVEDGRFCGDFQALADRASLDEGEISMRSRQVASRLDHPALRLAALDLLAQGRIGLFVLRMLRLSYLPGDCFHIDSAIAGVENWTAELRHDIAMGLRSIFVERNTPECRDLLIWAYEQTPCSLCRNGIVEILLCSGVAPKWLTEECLHDCDPGTRAMAQEAIDGRDFTIEPDDDE